MDALKESLVKYLNEDLGIEKEELSDPNLLFTNGLLDSFNLVDLITYIEKAAKIKIRATEVSLDNFDSIERMMSFIQRRTQSAGTGTQPSPKN